jgi:hypothetical protein
LFSERHFWGAVRTLTLATVDVYIKLVRQRIADNINVAENTRLLRKILNNAQNTADLK